MLSKQRIRHIRELLASYMTPIIICGAFFVWFAVSIAVYFVERDVPRSNISTFGDALWWGVVTLLTVGYGDYYPLSAIGRWLTVFLMFSGVLTMGVITAKLSSLLFRETLLKRQGSIDVDAIRNHFLICGWKDDMSDLLDHILLFNTDMKPEDVVILANFSEAQREAFHEQDRYRDVNIVFGEPIQIDHLKRVKPHRARKIFLLADRSQGESAMIPSAQEADARTIMTAINLSTMARGVSITAEVLDPRLDSNLRMAGVTDVVYSREYSRLMLGNAASGTGIANVVYDLLNPKTPFILNTIPIAEKYHHLTYGRFKASYEADYPARQVVGILENTGNPHQMRDRALREAQKTADVKKMIRNLKVVKDLRFNKPIFNPDADYAINDRCSAIVIDCTLDGSGREAA